MHRRTSCDTDLFTAARFHEAYTGRYLRATDARSAELSGPYDARLLGAVAAVDELLADAGVHGFADSARRASSSILP